MKSTTPTFITRRLLACLVLGAAALLSPAAASAQWATSGSDINNTNTGRVGIGSTVFDAWGNMFKVVAINADKGFTIAAGNTSGYAFHFTDRAYYDGSAWRYSASSTPVSNQYIGSGFFGVRVAPGGTAGSSLTWTKAFFINNDGNIGVGTDSPGSARLHVVGNNTAAGGYAVLRLQNTQAGGRSWWLYSGATGSNAPESLGVYDETAGQYRMFFDGAGRVGVGTTSPTEKLHVAGNARIGLDGYAYFSELNSETDTVFGYNALTASAAGSLKSGPANSSGLHPQAIVMGPGQGIRFITTGSWPGAGADFSLDGNEKMRITPGGNVGVGVASPAEKLEVAGNIKSSGGITAEGTISGGEIVAKYQDVAEWVPSTQKLTAGTVVVLDPGRSNHVLASTTPYDTAVAGVVSARPGISLGEGGEGKVLVATTGRVKVRVDATRSPIKVGDLLVTGDAEGFAVRSEPVLVRGRRMHAPGTIVGKALEPLASGVGEILVLLSLQ